MKMKGLLILSILSIQLIYGQQTKVITVDLDQYSKEVFQVLNSDESIRHGMYDYEVMGKVLKQGRYENGKKVGVWKYFDSTGEVCHKFDVENKTLVYDKFAEENAKFDTTKYNSPLIILGGINGGTYKMVRNIKYPSNARRNGIEGQVWIKIIINSKGIITERIVTEGIDPECDAEALKASKLIEFDCIPAVGKDGKSRESEIAFPINFKLG